MPRYQAVFLDLDGTLITTEKGITEADREAVAAAKAAGISVFISTGRSVKGTVYVHRDLGTNSPLFSYNGAIVHDPERAEHLVHHRLPDEACEKLFETAEELDLTVLCFFDDEIWAHHHEIPALHALTGRLERSGVQWAADRSALPQRRLTKAWVLASPQHADVLERRTGGQRCHWIRPRMGDLLAGTGLLLTAATGAPELKAGPLHYIARTQGIPIDAMVAVGDHDNDVEALQTAGLGVAVAGASPAALEAADRRIGPASDGSVARLLMELGQG